MINNKKDDWEFPFEDVLLSKREAKKVYIALLFAVISTLLICFILGIENKSVVFLICLASSFFSYFVIVPKIIKNDNKAQQKNRGDRE
jgi:hypothetical protein